ncbi:HLA class II histocompatibility antigen, DQ beta 2 chain-like [Emydura macquarii macquarii]|uniref:HLA class II histocompatibility antigen, DQ beta 2 chain-like n=1 Tax=Emydura macquarii macquarii TaxID=1129001 RepID=UPI00352A7BDE
MCEVVATSPSAIICSQDDSYDCRLQHRGLVEPFMKPRNSQEHPAGLVPTELLQNTDWTFQILGMREMTPGPGDVYACQVEHINLRGPLLLGTTCALVFTVAQADSARGKMLAGIKGYVLGLVFMVPELLIYLNIKKGERLRDAVAPGNGPSVGP